MTETMEEHFQAYFAWKRAGIRDAWCWHVDAHLDLSRDGLDEACLAALREGRPAPKGSAYLPWGGLHCGNYLYPSIREGIVGRLTWVIPPYLPEGKFLPWARAHLDGWIDMEVPELAGLADRGGYLEGTLLGIPFQLGTAAALPSPDKPVLLDVDLDYFLTHDGDPWQDSADLPRPEAVLTTVAYSVLGGYTPEEHRQLARVFTDDWDGYRATDLDRAAALVRRQRYGEALPLLAGDSHADAYLAGSCHYHLKQMEEAFRRWNDLRRHPDLPADGRIYLAGLCSEVLVHLQRPQEALELARLGLAGAPDDYRLYWAAAVAHEQLGQLAEATRQLRRGLKLAEPYAFGLRMRYALARLYRQQGKEGLAAMELARLERLDLTGQLRPLTLLR